MQILIGKKLSPEKNLFLKNLRSNLNIAEARRTIIAYKSLKGFESKNAYIDRLAKANPTIFKEMMRLYDYGFKEFLIEALTENEELLIERDRYRDMQKAKEIARNLKLSDVPLSIIVNTTKLSLEEVEAL